MLGAIIGDIVGSIYEIENYRAKDFEDAIRNAISFGGDSDTVAAIAGGVAEALFGIPDAIRKDGLARLPADMSRVLRALYGWRDRSG